MRYTLYYQVYKDLVFQIAGLTAELTQLRESCAFFVVALLVCQLPGL